jgi:hypothetical protein
MRMLAGTHRNIITAGSARKLENLIVTHFPMIARAKKSQSGSVEALTTRKQTRMPWIVRVSGSRKAWFPLRPVHRASHHPGQAGRLCSKRPGSGQGGAPYDPIQGHEPERE